MLNSVSATGKSLISVSELPLWKLLIIVIPPFPPPEYRGHRNNVTTLVDKIQIRENENSTIPLVRRSASAFFVVRFDSKPWKGEERTMACDQWLTESVTDRLTKVDVDLMSAAVTAVGGTEEDFSVFVDDDDA